MPFPITHTQFTVLTRVCIWDANKSPIKMRTMALSPLTKEHMTVHSRRKSGDNCRERLLTCRTGYVGASYVQGIDSVRHKHFCTLNRPMPELLYRVTWMCPPLSKYQVAIYTRQTAG